MVVAKFGKDAFDKFLTDAFSEAVKNSNDKEWLLGWIRTKSLNVPNARHTKCKQYVHIKNNLKI